ncbi:MAG TPA: LysR family transcriptional regulator [Casimicrobiaceae bacterium]|nr:LysR family transcriptional regulator [Casimicrobiaceae bacterium]
MNVTVRQLRAFDALAGIGSFTRAAAALHTTQPALSAQIRELESILGVRLFDRNTRSVALTSTGTDLLPVIGKILGDLDGVVAHARDIASRSVGNVALAALPSVAATCLPQVIAGFRAAHPGIVVRLHDALAQGVADLVRDGAVDFGISGATGNDPALIFEPLGTDRMVAVLPPDHPLARVRRLSLADLAGVPLVLMDRHSSVRSIVDRAYATHGKVPLPAYEAAFMATAMGMVRAGLGVTVLPASAFELATATDLAIRALDDPALERTLGLVQRAGRTLSPAAQAFAVTVRRSLGAWLRRGPRAQRLPAPRKRRR